MQLYAAINLHSNNSFLVILDEEDRTVFSKRLLNELRAIVAGLQSRPGRVAAVAVEQQFELGCPAVKRRRYTDHTSCKAQGSIDHPHDRTPRGILTPTDAGSES